MSFEEEHISELEQQKENERIQQELDLAIARIENGQIQRALDEAIESLDQETFDQDENTEEEVVNDQTSQHSSVEEEHTSGESITEEKSNQQDSLGRSIGTWNDEHSPHQAEKIEDEVVEDQVAQDSFSTEEKAVIEDSIIEEHLDDESSKCEHDMTIEQQNQSFRTSIPEEGVSSIDTIIEENSIQAGQVFTNTASQENSHDSVTEENTEKFNLLQISVSVSSDDQYINHQEEKTRQIQEVKDEKGTIPNHISTNRSDLKEECHLNENQDKKIPLAEKNSTNLVLNNDRKSEILRNQSNLEKIINHTPGKISKQDISQNIDVQKPAEKTKQNDRFNDEVTANQEIKKLNPKAIAKEWNKYVLEGKSVPEEFQKQVFRQYNSGSLKDAGLIQKDGKWFLETTWENYHLVKSFIEYPQIQKSLAFQLWAEFKTEKPLHFVQRKLKKNALYFSIKLEKSSSLPHELIGKRVYVRNTKNFFSDGHSVGHYLQTTLKSFETSFLKKIKNWGIPKAQYKEIRDEIFHQFSEKYGDLFEKVMVIPKRPIVFMQPYTLDSLEKSFIKCFVEYFSEGSRLWKFTSRNGRKAYNSYYRNFNFQSLSVMTRLIDKEIKGSINQDSPFVKQGNICVKSNNPKDFKDFTEKWNQYVNDGRKITQDMWVTYNKIQKITNYPLRRFMHLNMEQYSLHYYYDLAHKFENLLERRGRFPTSLYKTWFTFREIKKGPPSFIKVKIVNPLTGSYEKYYLPNVDYHWNKNPTYKKSSIQKTSKDRTGIRMIMDTFMEEIPIKDPQTKRIRDLIIEELKLKGFCGLKKADVWFKHIYKMNYDNNLVDEILEQYFWREYNANRLWKDRGYRSRTRHLQELISYYKGKGRRFKNFSKDLVDLAIIDKFKIALIDKSNILDGIFNDLREKLGIKTNISREQFWNFVSDGISTQSLAKIIQKNKIRDKIDLNLSYSIKEARLDYHPDITSKPKQFWNESLNNGLTRFSAAIIQSRKVRNSINKVVEKKEGLGPLFLPKITCVEDHWGKDTSNGNIITFPDCISYEITKRVKKGKALETIQNKVAREISGGHAGSLTARIYLLDFFKTIGNRNDETGVLKLQLEIIPKGETLGGLINDHPDSNHCIISYWGKSTKKIQRIGEITNAFVLGRFEENITSKDELVNFIMSKINQGESALNGTKLESVDKKVIEEHVSSLEPLENLTLTKFCKDWFIEIMRRYENDLKFN